MTATAQTTKALVAKARSNGNNESVYDKDTQRQRVYASERVLATWNTRLTEAQCKALAKKVTTSAYVIKHYGRVNPTVSFTNRGNCSWADWQGNITLNSMSGMTTETVLHELAHLYTMNHGRGHGWLFCKVLLDLVRKFMGADAAAALRASFVRHKVKHQTPRAKRTMTAAEREAARERLAAARAKRAPSTGEWVVAIKFKNRTSYSFVKSMSKRSLRMTAYSAFAMTRKTDASAAKMFAEAKRYCFQNENVYLVDRSKLPGTREAVQDYMVLVEAGLN